MCDQRKRRADGRVCATQKLMINKISQRIEQECERLHCLMSVYYRQNVSALSECRLTVFNHNNNAAHLLFAIDCLRYKTI